MVDFKGRELISQVVEKKNADGDLKNCRLYMKDKLTKEIQNQKEVENFVKQENYYVGDDYFILYLVHKVFLDEVSSNLPKVILNTLAVLSTLNEVEKILKLDGKIEELI